MPAQLLWVLIASAQAPAWPPPPEPPPAVSSAPSATPAPPVDPAGAPAPPLPPPGPTPPGYPVPVAAPPPGYYPPPPPGAPAPPPAAYPPGPPPYQVSANPAPERELFGAPGQLVVTAAYLSILNSEHVDSMTLSPQLDVFVTRMLTLGGRLSYRHEKVGTTSTTEFNSVGLGVKIGLNFTFGQWVSMWPTLENAYTALDKSRTDYTTTSLFIPVLFHPASHFFIGIGPSVTASRELASDAEAAFSSGIETMLGGWW